MTSTSTLSPGAQRGSAAFVDRVGTLEYPTKRHDAWRYAPHAKLALLTFGPSVSHVPSVPAEVEEQIPTVDGSRIVVVNGVVDPTRSDLAELPAGLTVRSLAEVATNEPERLDRYLDPDADDAFAVVNLAFGTDGAFVAVGEGHQLDAPIHVVNISLPGQAQNGSCAGVIIELEPSSAATVIETHIGGEISDADASGGSNIRTTIALGANASLEHIVLQDLPPTQIHLGTINVTQGERSEFNGRSFNLGASFGRLAHHVELVGEGARANLSGLFLGRGEQILDQQITVVHGAKNCVSRQTFRGVLDDDSVGVFNGGIDVRPGADGTDAEQSNANLLLSKRAEVNSQPRLEILADDVSCKHGATVGQLDETALYYLRSRGIPADDARRLLIRGFADQTVEELGIETLRTWVSKRLGHNDG